MSGAVWGLSLLPEELAKVHADRALIPGLVPEIIRWQTPVIHMRRAALADARSAAKGSRRATRS
jgi:cytochrome P450